MQDRSKINKLEKVVRFHEQECAVLKDRVSEQYLAVINIQKKIDSHIRELDQTQHKIERLEMTPFNLQLVSHLMSSIQTKLSSSRQELTIAQSELQQRQANLRQKMSKIESLEKLIAKKTGELMRQANQREQHRADERYLNTTFNGLKR